MHIGQEFITAFLQNSNRCLPSAKFELTVTAFSAQTTVNVFMINRNYSRSINLNNAESKTFTLPNDIELVGSGLSDTSVLVTANHDISVIMISSKTNSSDRIAVLPVDQLERTYYIVTPSIEPMENLKEFVVVNYDMPSKVTIFVKGWILFNEHNITSDNPLIINLRPFQVFQLQSSRDLSGTKVSSNNVMAVLSGVTCSWSNKHCGHVFEQLNPVSNWGKEYFVAPIPYQFRYDILYVSAFQYTEINYTSSLKNNRVVLHSGDVITLGIRHNAPIAIFANVSIQVLYYCTGGINERGLFDTFFIALPDVSRFCTKYNIHGLKNITNAALITTMTSTVAGVKFNRISLESINWKPIPGTKYSWALYYYGQRFKSHIVNHLTSSLSVLSVGMSSQESYGLSGVCIESKNPCAIKRCRKMESCRIINQKPLCIPESEAICQIWGDPHYQTFDGLNFDFHGTCTYTLAKTCMNLRGSGDNTLPEFTIMAKYSNRGSRESSYIAEVSVHIDEYNITLVQYEFGFARVNNIKWALPVFLDQGRIRIVPTGFHALLETPFIRIRYDWDVFLFIKIPSSFFENVCGLCGNYNGNKDDDMETAEGAQASNVIDFGKSWKMKEECYNCWDDCYGQCQTFLPEVGAIYKSQAFCGIISQIYGPFYRCHSVVKPGVYVDNCVHDMIRHSGYKKVLCEAISVYLVACHIQGVRVEEWRTDLGCEIECPENSWYNPCGDPCPETCAGLLSSCQEELQCMETCECNFGFVLHKDNCIPKEQCGSFCNGHYYPPKEMVWGDDGCTQKCWCDTRLVQCLNDKCQDGEECAVRDGIKDCYPTSYSKCSVFGDLYYVSFDGAHFDFHGRCRYQLTALCDRNRGLTEFSVEVFNRKQGVNNVSYTTSVVASLYGVEILFSRENKGRVKLNGILFNLPINLHNELIQVFSDGWNGVILTKFGLKVTYDWHSHITVTLPSSYLGAVCGLCGNFNRNAQDDMTMKNGEKSQNVSSFVQSWRTVDYHDECEEMEWKSCPLIQVIEKVQRQTLSECGIILNDEGPFSDCHDLVIPEEYFQKCLNDFCWHSARQDVFCEALEAYAAACQAANGTVGNWRDNGFCKTWCLHNSYYMLCSKEYPKTCSDIRSPSGCNDFCRESCVCEDGYLFDVDRCVHVSECGCTLNGAYYKVNEEFYPTLNCDERCVCEQGGLVKCHPFSCSPHEVCKESNGVRKCHPTGSALCSVIGGSHYTMFDGVNDISYSLPLDHQDKGFWVEQHGISVLLATNFGLQVTYDLDSQVMLNISSSFHGQVCGLCGNYNGDTTDDFRLPDGLLEINPTAFGGTWKDDSLGLPCRSKFQERSCPPCQHKSVYDSDKYCGILLLEDGPFSACHNHLDPLGHFNNCVHDLCQTCGKARALCNSLQGYMAVCQSMGITGMEWRKSSMCPLDCPQYSHYNTCADTCTTTCARVVAPTLCPIGCSEGCQCNDGYYLDRDRCVPLGECGCYIEGRYYTEKCQMVSGKPVCIPDSEAYCHAVGDPHYRTFDGYFYDFQGTCTYTIAKTCNGDSSLPNFNIEAKNENRGNTRVAYVSYVNVQVNNQRQRLPINLNDGQVRLYQSGGSVIIETDFKLRIYYDWNSILKVYISSSFFESVCGLCGNYNGNPSDDLITSGGVKAPNVIDFGKSWKVEDGDRFCWHNCNGECKTCPLETQRTYAGEQSCGLLSKVLNGPFRKCHSVIDPKTYVDNCVYDLCMNAGSKQILCQSLKTYAEACQRSKVEIDEWRSLAGCPMQCPENSEYKLCSKACPATCNDDATPSVCAESCVESCQCIEGYVLDEGKCIPKASCGCIYQGKVYALNDKFWGDNKCQQQCTCNPATKKVECKATRCKSSETCSVVNGIQNCYPISYGTCSASGDPHYISFDGLRYDFQGTCIYQFAGLCKKSDDLVDFQVNVQNEFRGSKVVSYTSAVQIKLCGLDIWIKRQYKDRILVNGLLTNLPFTVDKGKLSIYKQGFFAILQTNYGLRVSYNWDSRVAVTLPSSYAGAVCGLCGNFDGKKDNDLTMKNNQLATKPVIFGNSWKVENVPGCYEEDKGECTKLAELELRHINNKQGCGILKDKDGPFRECHAKINPDGHYKSCVYDACFYENREDVICKIIASYAAECQEAGVTIYPWRTNKFCRPSCPKNSHYEVCVSGCAPTCHTFSPPLGCNPICSEGCQCDDGFILSGGDCVPISKCGCKYNDGYYQLGQVFYPSGFCNQKCVCTESGAVECKAFTCGPNEECKVIDGVQKCQPVGSAQCSAAGDPHYMSFDGRAFDFQGTCTYTLSKTITNNDNLVSFAINVKNEKWGNGRVAVTKLVSLEVYGYNLILQYGVRGRVMINGVYNNIPVNLENDKIRVFQHGSRVIINTDFELQVNYDLVYHVIVTVPGNYKNQLGGLCGNYNGDKQDDFQLPNGTLTTDATIFGSSWKVQIPGVTCDDGCGGSGNPCPSCDERKKEIFKTENYCGFLKKVGGPLSACYDTINPDTYFNNCIYDLCAGVGDGDILCHSIHSYVAACHAAGVTIQPWRTDAFCPMTCPANSKYKVCADVCSSTCAGITDPAKCPTTCSEGCECNDGFFFDGKDCVSMDKCGCFEDGKYYQPNEKVLSNDCKQSCTCSPVGGLICEDTGCTDNEECKIQDGAFKCINKDPCKSIMCKVKETCQIQNGNAVCVPDFSGTCWAWGDPHYHTFDGYNYDFQGTCTYILSQYDGKDPGLVPFTIEEKNDNRGSQAVSYVRTVSIYVYGFKITLMKGEFGKVRVNDVITNLPAALLDGKVSVSISGLNAVVRTDFGLQITYEYNWHVVVTLTSSYYGLTRGLCGNFNQNTKDELITSDNKVVSSVIDWAKSWKVNDRDPFCFDYCPGLNCPTCDDAKKNLYGGDNKCGLISKVANGPFRECHPKVNPDNFFDSCLYDVCINGGSNQFLCQALNAYANTCRKQGVKIYDWRTPSGCVETCQCNDGFVLSGDKCVPTSSCGCSYKGAYYQANEEFWADENCRMLCKCDPSLGMVVCKESSCKQSERCMVTNGVRGCQPLSFSTCTGSGDPHYTTFDGKRFDFMGTCIYQLVGVSSSDRSLTSFNVQVQNNNRGGNKAVSYTKVVTLEVYGTVFMLSMDYPRRILVDGVVTSLPYYFQSNKVVAYINGRQGILKTDFEITVTYDWESYVAVTIPSTYANVQGLCGNNNKNPNDDFNMKNGKPAPNAVDFGNSWKVGDVAGCSPECTGSCPLCTEAQKQAYKGDNYCGLIKKPNGPFGLCLSVIDPTPYFNDCIYDACQYKGHPTSFCKAIGLYVSACQDAGVKLEEWRKPTFCSMSCPVNTHYELCGNACPVTCHGLSSPTGCDSSCKEACYCDNGFILSGHNCVPIRDCGCVYQDKYYQKNEVFYPQGQCNQRCQCGADGIVKCQSEACRPEEECKLVNGAWGCQPKETGKCVASGDPHYISFDGLKFDFQGTCTYIFSKVVVDDPRLVNYSVVVENESYGNGKVAVTRLVVVYVYGYTVAIERNMRSKVKFAKLPLTLGDDSIVINQEGANVVIRTDFGLEILYDTTYHVVLNIPGSYRGKLGGLCGNFNGDNKDEFQLPNKQVVKNVNEFGVSWKVNIAGAKCSDGCEEGVCPVCNDAKLQPYKATSSCGMITDPAGPFKACHSKVNPNEYFNHCIYDACAVDGKDNVLCKSLQAYAAACHLVGVTIGSWRTPAFCPMSCPANSHYELCTRTCEQTCSGLTAPTKCTERCFEGCECNDGYVLDGDTCVSMDKCGCVFSGRYLSEGESFVSADCTQQCKCQAGGVTCTAVSCSSCSGIKCQAKETCRIVNGKPVCVPDSGAYCHAVGDPHYRTFDGYFYDFQGTCTYTIAKTCSNDSNLPYFNIEAKNENRGNTRVSYVSFVNVQVYEHTISLVRSEYAVVRVNNQRQRLPINLNNGQVQLYQSGSSIIIETDFSLRVYYDWNALLKVYITSSFFGRVCGLCGNYNGNFSDELMTSDGVQAPNLVSFGKSWKVEDGDRFCWHNCNGECKTCPLGTQQFYAGEQSCGLLSKVLDGPFFPCHSVIDPKTYVDNCVYDLCMNSGSKQTLCQSLKTYAEACQQSKVEIREWRSLIGCPMQCPANSEYKLCSKACPATCNDATPSVCADYCVESCQCIEETQKQAYKGDSYCGLITNPSGPFNRCLSIVDPVPYFNDCIFDACQYKGHPSSFCKTIGLYVAACQAAGIPLEEWRKPSFCSMSCPTNTHYELCGNGCPVTCYDFSSPTGCDVACMEACYCNDGFILSGHKCVPIGDCGCVYQDKYYQKNEVFYPQAECNQRCQCGADGMVNCLSVPCRPDEECKLVNGALGCQPMKSGRCVASGDPHYISFDGLKFDFQGNCTYIFAKVVVSDPRLVNFSVVVENEGFGKGRLAVTRGVLVNVYGYTVAIKRDMRSKVKVNGELVRLPLTLEDDRIVINQEGANVILQTDFGLKILYDTIYHVVLNISSSYSGKMGGLCGNFNGNDKDEFQLPNGQVVTNVNSFGASWKVNITRPKCGAGCEDGTCPVCNTAQLEQYSATTSCGMIINPTGPFQACHSKVNPNDYFNHCIYDSWAVDGKNNILCKSLQAYAAACHSVGGVVLSWRSPTFCPMSCPENSHYELCTRTCEQSCSSLWAPSKCTERCFEGCECNSGYILDGDTCVSTDKCGCMFNGRYLSVSTFSN
uniref:VWFD domain-containing protein n=2 Tax=Pyxicephalus adspersus TaxID=30357 RepID=A0AAV2ZKB2_PYXAD|nr:TPA: hypothetical protein GDO54_003201 [Pyxicephalus adspersus]